MLKWKYRICSCTEQNKGKKEQDEMSSNKLNVSFKFTLKLEELKNSFSPIVAG